MKYIKLYEQHNESITFKEWLQLNPVNINTDIINCSISNLIDLNGIEQFKNLKQLYCNNNNITELPELPEFLQYLYCYNNKLTSLPNLPNSLVILSCSNNNLPYNNLKEYKEWHKKTYPWIYKAKNYNI